ncbi:hypothetical protein BDR06DRAFT_1014872 [Suillus hirtellus]|nr:hypothetical protein BDR06DRAFT_1014872 [Suillus hirtellus]
MAEVHTNAFDINSFHEVEEQVGNVMEEPAGDGVEEHVGGDEHVGGIEHAETFTVMPLALVLWDYAQEIVQDDMDYVQTHPDMPLPIHPPPPPPPPPIQMSYHEKCLLALMVEDRYEEVSQLWQALNKIEHLLGLEHI